MKILQLTIIGIVVLLALLNNNVYSAFDESGNYYCDSSNIGLEEEIYKAAVNTLNFQLQEYWGLNPSAPTIQLHDYIIKSSSGTIEPTYDIMNKAKECLQSNDVDPNTVSKPDKFTLMVASAPEFGSSVSLIILVSILMVTLINRQSIKSLRINLH